MNDVLSGLLIACSLMIAVWSAVLVARGRRINDPLLFTLVGLEVALLVQMIWGFVALAGTDREVDGTTFVAYLLTLVLIIPAAVLWSIAEKSRWGSAVLVAGCLVVAVLMLRLEQIWSGSGA
ncbi:MAG: hypothetical protein GEU93_21515 [Propionibacteriales bacterium]|nr:hypothetical protein [Propionibacteriales bacterium]